MSYEVEKFVKAKREDYDDTRCNELSLESLEIFRQSRVASPEGQAVTALLWPSA